jgi:hypothetical protein
MKLTLRKKKAIAALLEAKSIIEAAIIAKVGERTLRRWLAEDSTFQEGLTRAGDDLINSATRRLIHGQEAALDTLEKVMSGSSKDEQRRLAAQGWLELTLKWQEQRILTQRLATLERLIDGNENDETT